MSEDKVDFSSYRVIVLRQVDRCLSISSNQPYQFYEARVNLYLLVKPFMDNGDKKKFTKIQEGFKKNTKFEDLEEDALPYHEAGLEIFDTVTSFLAKKGIIKEL